VSANFSKDEIMRYARDFYHNGFIRSGSEAEAKSRDYISGKFKEFGLSNITVDKVPFIGWDATQCRLVIYGAGKSASFPVEPWFYMSFTDPCGLETKLVDVGSGEKKDYEGKDVQGKIVMAEFNFGEISFSILEQIARHKYDPGDTLAQHRQVMNWRNELVEEVYNNAVAAGAAGIIGIIPFNTTVYMRLEGADFTSGVLGKIPGATIRQRDAKILKELVAGGTDTGHLIVTGRTQPKQTYTVYGKVPGKTDNIVMIASHHDSMWLGATEDAAACAIVLALARYFAGKPKKMMNNTLLFNLEASEQLFAIGGRTFVREHKQDIMKKCLIDLHIEHICEEFIYKDGVLVDTGLPQPRAMFVTENDALMDIAHNAIKKNDIKRTLVMSTKTPLGVPTDAFHYDAGGYPVISFVSAPPYWNALEDTLDKIRQDDLAPVAEAFCEMIEEIDRLDPRTVRPDLPK